MKSISPYNMVVLIIADVKMKLIRHTQTDNDITFDTLLKHKIDFKDRP